MLSHFAGVVQIGGTDSLLPIEQQNPNLITTFRNLTGFLNDDSIKAIPDLNPNNWHPYFLNQDLE
jgi:hypothetical protein